MHNYGAATRVTKLAAASQQKTAPGNGLGGPAFPLVLPFPRRCGVTNSKYRRAWAVVKIFTEAPGFGPGQFVFLGHDNFRPDETQVDFESRVCKQFDIDKRHRLRYVEVDM